LQENKAIPIWIGLFEASAIATEMEHVVFSRPMTHDLLYECIKALDVTVNRIEIVDIRNNTFFATIHLIRAGQAYAIDARPSDAIALALRAQASIFVEESVLEKSRNIDFGMKLTDIDQLKEDKIKEFLENLSAEDFGKYKM
jgi:uncharacterized protein